MTPEEKHAIVDDEHLRLLALFHYIFGGITVAFALLGGVCGHDIRGVPAGSSRRRE